MLSKQTLIPTVKHYGFAILVCIPALVVAAFYSPLASQEYLFALFAVALSSWIGGFGPGLCTTCLMILGVNSVTLLTVREAPSFLAGVMQSGAFGLLGIIISWLQDYQIRSRRQLSETQSLLEAVLENVADGITAQDMNRQPIFANAAAANLTGLNSGSEIIYTPISALRQNYQSYSTEGALLAFEELPNYMAIQNRVPAERTYRSLNMTSNTSHWLNHRSTPVFDNKGNLRFIVNILRDVTEDFRREEKLKHLLELLEEQNHRYQAILNNIPGVVWEVTGSPNSGQVPHFISPYVQTMLGYTPQELIEDPNLWEALLPDEDRPLLIKEAMRIYESQDYGRMTYHWLTRDKRQIDVESYTTIKRDENGQVISVYGVTMDVSARIAAEAAVARYTEELKNANEELRLFAYITSHDLQEPLRMIISYLELIRQRYTGKLDTNADEFIAFAADGAARMKLLLEGLLSYARVGSKERTLAEVDVSLILRSALRNLSIQIEDTGATIKTGEMPKILADDQQIGQVFQNLISNALKFRKVGVPPEITIHAERQAHSWRFSVTDNGIGIDKKHTDRIFLIFQRLHSRAEFDGTGIGLAICKKIVERYHGIIGVDSEPGRGSTFYFTIPDDVG